jgi:NAD(P)-dependent dehydrogenase (short-subunit alcohol dehydrogenase family)
VKKKKREGDCNMAPKNSRTPAPAGCCRKIINCGCLIIQMLVLILLLLFSGVPSQLGLFRYLSTINPASIGLTPAFNVGVEDGYTFAQLDKLDLTGQNALITGGNSGVGYETAKYLVKLGAAVTIVCRSENRCKKAVSDIIDGTGKTRKEMISYYIADMSDLKDTRDATAKYAKTISKLDMLFLNAGIASAGVDENGRLPLSVDGIEKVFATNVIGHHAMWKILEGKVKKSKLGRIVLTSSASHFDSYDYGVATDLNTLNSGELSMLPYGQSKLAQVLWSQELTRQLGPDSTVFVNSYHPGAAATQIWFTNPMIPKAIHPLLRFITKNVMWTSLEGALTMLYLGAASEELKSHNIRGKYFHPQAREVVPNPKFANDLELQKKFWKFADSLV